MFAFQETSSKQSKMWGRLTEQPRASDANLLSHVILRDLAKERVGDVHKSLHGATDLVNQPREVGTEQGRKRKGVRASGGHVHANEIHHSGEYYLVSIRLTNIMWHLLPTFNPDLTKIESFKILK